MHIKELEDVLKLVDELPEKRQRACVLFLAKIVKDWEAQTAEGVSDAEWLEIRTERRALNTQLALERLERNFHKIEKHLKRKGPR